MLLSPIFCKTEAYVLAARVDDESIPKVKAPLSLEKSIFPKSDVEFKITL